MGVKLEKKTEVGAQLKLISVHDDSIDWKNTYPDESSTPRKKSRYLEEHNIADLVFIEGVEPDLFVFDHPHRTDVSKKIRGLYSRQMSSQQETDLFSESFHKAFIGIEKGLDGGVLEEAPRRNGLITDAFMQALEDSGVFDELALAFVKASSRNRGNDQVNKKKITAWIEWHWADFKALAEKGRKFDCSKCPASIQRVRRCHEDKWDHVGGKFPIRITDYSEGFGFCPAKLFRDDIEFADDTKQMFLSWKLGQVPFGHSLDTMPEDQSNALLTLIQGWEFIEKAEDFRKLGRLLGGGN